MKGKPTLFAVVSATALFALAQAHAQTGRIYGKVYTRDDQVFKGRIRWDDQEEQYQGRIRWDDDETMTYEFLDGELESIPVMIEFGDIQSIQRCSSTSGSVRLKSGKTLKLQGTCDVNDDNRGIFVEGDGGEMVRLDGDEFDREEFGRP